MGYPKERKEAVLKKMLPPHSKSIQEIAKEEGIAEGTLYNWRKAARAHGRLMPDGDSTPQGWGASDKFAAVVEAAPLNETELSAYCRERGLYPEQIQRKPGQRTNTANIRRKITANIREYCSLTRFYSDPVLLVLLIW